MIWLFFLLLSDPVLFQARMNEGIAALDRGDLRKAQANFEAATKLADDPGAWMMLAQTLARENESRRAREAADKAEALGATNPRILQALVNFHTALVPDLRKAASVGAQYAAKAPADVTAWRNVAALYLEIGDSAQAIAAGRRGLPADHSAELHMILGRALANRQEWPDACAEFETAIQLSPYQEEPRFLLAQAYLLRQDFAHSAAVLQDARKVFDKSPQIELALGVAYYGQRKFDAAVAQFLRTIELAPNVSQAYVFLGRILDHAGARLPEITERFSRFEKQNPASDLGYTLHAKALMLALPPAGFPPEAEQSFGLLEKALAIREDSAEAHYLIGTLLERKREFATAAQQLERSIQLNANDSAVHFRLARVYDRMGRREDAERERALHEKLSEAEGSAPPPGLAR
jgi:tetratricopeptide (TPR) repeat protein